MKRKLILIVTLIFLTGTLPQRGFSQENILDSGKVESVVPEQEGGRELLVDEVFPVGANKLKVLVSVLPQKSLVEMIGKEKVSPESLVKAGRIPEMFDPTPAQLRAVKKAQVFFTVHASFEKEWLGKFIENNAALKIVDTTVGIALRNKDIFDDYFKEQVVGQDIYVWLSPQLFKTQAEIICKALIEIDAENRAYYQQNLNRVLVRLNDVSAEIKSILAPFKGKKFVAGSGSWGYFADEFGLVQAPIASKLKNPNEDFKHIVDALKKERIKTIFVQKQYNRRIAENVAEKINADVVVINPLAEGYFENLKSVALQMAESFK